eukprot:755068-Lingulodinium_polyedra.AAC.1
MVWEVHVHADCRTVGGVVARVGKENAPECPALLQCSLGMVFLQEGRGGPDLLAGGSRHLCCTLPC